MDNALKVPRMETIKKTAEIFGLSEFFVRQKVLSGEVVFVRAGKKYLVNIDKFAEYLNTGEFKNEANIQQPQQNEQHGIISATPRKGITPIPLSL